MSSRRESVCSVCTLVGNAKVAVSRDLLELGLGLGPELCVLGPELCVRIRQVGLGLGLGPELCVRIRQAGFAWAAGLSSYRWLGNMARFRPYKPRFGSNSTKHICIFGSIMYSITRVLG